MNEHGLRFRIGIFVLMSILLLAVLIVLFGRFPRLFRLQDRYTVVFDQASGVTPGTPVRRSGVRIGEVEKVELDDATGRVRVTILVDRSHPLFQNDRAVLRQGALSGDTSIDFVSPSAQDRAGSEERSSAREPALLRQVAFVQQPEQAPPPVPAPPPPQVRAQPGTEFRGTTQTDVAGILNVLSQLAPPARDAFQELTRSLERFDKMSPLLEETLREYRDLARTTRPLIPDLARTNDEIQVTARNWGRLGERLDVLLQANQDKLVKTLDNLNDAVVRAGSVLNEENQRNLAGTLKNLNAGTKNLDALNQNANELMKETRETVRVFGESARELQPTTKALEERGPRIIKNFDESTDRLNRTLLDVQGLLRAIDQNDGTIRRLISDPSLYNNLNEAACLLTRLFPRIDHILQDVEVFSDKIARHPESLGVGGAIRPSSGLKDVPSTNGHWPH
jgi:phospholipid/cholesterol/gamma-HCH transport system substrate-binding protein